MGFLSSYEGKSRSISCGPREVQGSPVSIQFVRGSAALLLSHGRGIGPQDGEGGILRSFSSWGRKPWVPLTCDSDLRELLMVPMGGQEYCGVGRASLDSTLVGAMEEGLISS